MVLCLVKLTFSSSKSSLCPNGHSLSVNSENVLISSFLSNTCFSSEINGFLTEGNILQGFGVGRTDDGTEPVLL